MSAIASLVTEAIETEGFEVVKLRALPNKNIRVWIDQEPNGVTVGDCANLSRIVRDHCEDCGLDPGEYQIEIQSPGVDRLLAREKDFVRFKGENVKVRLYEQRAELARKNFSGTLLGLIDGEVVVQGDDTWHFTQDEIDEVRLNPTLPGIDKEKAGGTGRKRKPRKSRRKRPKDH